MRIAGMSVRLCLTSAICDKTDIESRQAQSDLLRREIILNDLRIQPGH
ncbi:MAG: hypothetical protein JWN70_631 [Planctomycetaceae bacterium]|nr:hypothetical protein [Planctomycetaceae bacterium]